MGNKKVSHTKKVICFAKEHSALLNLAATVREGRVAAGGRCDDNLILRKSSVSEVIHGTRGWGLGLLLHLFHSGLAGREMTFLYVFISFQ